MQVTEQMAQSVACLERSTSLMSGEGEKLELEAMWPARVLLTRDAHFQPSKCRGIQDKQFTVLARNDPHHDKLVLHSGILLLRSTPYTAVILCKRRLLNSCNTQATVQHGQQDVVELRSLPYWPELSRKLNLVVPCGIKLTHPGAQRESPLAGIKIKYLKACGKGLTKSQNCRLRQPMSLCKQGATTHPQTARAEAMPS